MKQIIGVQEEHSCASILHSSGIPMKNIQEWLGDSQIATTMDLYTHLDYQSKEDAAQLLNNLKGNNK